MVDRFSRWREAVPMKDATTHSCLLLKPSSLYGSHGLEFLHIYHFYDLGFPLPSPGHTLTPHYSFSGFTIALMARLSGPEWVAELPWVAYCLAFALLLKTI